VSWPHAVYKTIMDITKTTSCVTVNACINWAKRKLSKASLYFGHGTDNALDEAAFLVLKTLNLPFDSDESILNSEVSLEARAKIVAIIEKRITVKIPAPYLVNEAWFAGLAFYVDERVLIPRSPIAEIIEEKFSPWLLEDGIKNILDIGTGSGCIAIASAIYLPQAEVDATDISSDALEVAKINVLAHKVQKRVNLIQSDVFNNVPKKSYDVIISNPPYVDQQDMQDLPSEYLHEPNLALSAGENGLDIVESILKNAHNYLSDKGILIVEVGNSAEALVAKYPKLPFVWLEFARGEAEVFLLNRNDLHKNL
jgi:ribosomal protein L3 glutamine methyltransferase